MLTLLPGLFIPRPGASTHVSVKFVTVSDRRRATTTTRERDVDRGHDQAKCLKALQAG